MPSSDCCLEDCRRFLNDETTWGAAISLDADGYDAATELPAGLLTGMSLILEPINRFQDEVSPQWAMYREAQTPDGAPISDVPTLLLGGVYDPTTPLANAERAAERLGRSTVLEVPAVSHDTWRSPCVQRVIRTFLAKPEGPPDTACFGEMTLSFLTP